MLSKKHVLLNRLTQERGTLFYSVEFMPEDELVRPNAMGEWSGKDVLGHVAAWEAEMVRAIEQFLAGQRPALWDIRDDEAWNVAEAAKRCDLTLAQVNEELIAVRRRLLDLLAPLPDEAFTRSGPPPDNNRAFVPAILNTIADHDREHWMELMRLKERWVERQQAATAA